MTRPKILLGVTGSVAAKLTPRVAKALQEIGDVKIIATKPSLYFWKRDDVSAEVWTDEMEWVGDGYVKDQEIPHIALGDWADILVVAPLTANTLAKMALGFSDNLLTCLYTAWPVEKPIVIAPAMNTRMWNNETVGGHIAKLHKGPTRHLVASPVRKRLACGTTGVGAMADIDDIVKAVKAALP